MSNNTSNIQTLLSNNVGNIDPPEQQQISSSKSLDNQQNKGETRDHDDKDRA